MTLPEPGHIAIDLESGRFTTRPYATGYRSCRVYRAEDRAASVVPVLVLNGTVKAAQAYVDRITRSAWWKRTCPSSWLGCEAHDTMGHFCMDRVPRRVIVREGRGSGGWALYGTRNYRGRRLPTITLGRKSTAWCPLSPLSDPWIILHELAHVMTSHDADERGHGREFARTFLLLVRRWLGSEAAAALRAAYREEGVKWTSRSS